MTPFSDEEMEIIHEMRQILRSWGETLQKKIDTPPTPILLPRMMVPEPKGSAIREPDRVFLGQRDYYGICDHCMMPECDCEIPILQKSFSSKHPLALVETKMEETIQTKQERVQNSLQPYGTLSSVQCPPSTTALSTVPPPASMRLASDLRLAIVRFPQCVYLRPTQPVTARTESVHSHNEATRIHFDARIGVCGPDRERFHEPVHKPPDTHFRRPETRGVMTYLGSKCHDPPDPTLDGPKCLGPRPKLGSLYEVVCAPIMLMPDVLHGIRAVPRALVRVSSEPIRVSLGASDVPNGQIYELPLSKSPSDSSTSNSGKMIMAFIEAVSLVPTSSLGIESSMKSVILTTRGFADLHLNPCERSKMNKGLGSQWDLCDEDFGRFAPKGEQIRRSRSLGDQDWRPCDARIERLLLTGHDLKCDDGATIAGKGTPWTEGIGPGVTIVVKVGISAMPVDGTEFGLALVERRSEPGPKEWGEVGPGGVASFSVMETGGSADLTAEMARIVKPGVASLIGAERKGPKVAIAPSGPGLVNAFDLGPGYGNFSNGPGYRIFANNFEPCKQDFGFGYCHNEFELDLWDCKLHTWMGYIDFGVKVAKCEKLGSPDWLRDDSDHKLFAQSFLEGNSSHMGKWDLHVRVYVEQPKKFAHTVKGVHRLDGRTPISKQSPISNNAATVTKLSSLRINVPCLVGDELSLYSMTRFAHPYLVFLMFIPCALVGQMISMVVGTHFPLSQDVLVLHISRLTGGFLTFVLSASMLLAWILFCFMVKTSGHKSIRTTMVYVIPQIPFLAYSVHFSGFVVQCLVSDLVSLLKMKHMGQQVVVALIVDSTIDDFTLMNLVNMSIRMELSVMGNMLEPTQGNLFVKEEILIGLHLEDKVNVWEGGNVRPQVRFTYTRRRGNSGTPVEG